MACVFFYDIINNNLSKNGRTYITYQEKLDNSVIVRTDKVYYKELNLPSAKQKRNSLIFFFFMALFTIYTKIILKSSDFDLLVIVNIVYLLSMFFLKLFSRTVYALNHFEQYRIVRFINNLSRLIIFITSFVMYIETLDLAIMEISGNNLFYNIVQAIGNDFKAQEYLLVLVLENPIKVFSLIFSVIVFIPVFFYFVYINMYVLLRVIVLCIPLINVLYYFSWLARNNSIFYQYEKSSEFFYDKHHRKITKRFYAFKKLNKYYYIFIDNIYTCYSGLFLARFIKKLYTMKKGFRLESFNLLISYYFLQLDKIILVNSTGLTGAEVSPDL